MATRTTKTRKTTATPWGPAHTVEQLTLPQRAGEKRFASVVQLLETEKGEQYVRFAYTTGGAVRRGPVTFYFPLLTCVVLSVVLTIVVNLFWRR